MTQIEKNGSVTLPGDALDQVDAGSANGMSGSGGETVPEDDDQPTGAGFKTPWKRIGKLHQGPGL